MTAAKIPRPAPHTAQADQAQTAKTGKGMPAKIAQADRARVGAAQTPHDAAVEASLALPHERDQSTDMTAEQPNPTIEQAQRDVARGLKDTSKSPEMDQAYNKLK